MASTNDFDVTIIHSSLFNRCRRNQGLCWWTFEYINDILMNNVAMTGDPVYTATGIVVASKSAGAEISNGVTVGHLATRDLANGTEYFWQVLAKNTRAMGHGAR